MSLLSLPYELQLIVVNYLKHDNHLDLGPLSQTCKHFSLLIADKNIWTDTVTILESSTNSNSLHLTNGFNYNTAKLPIHTLQAIAYKSTVPLINNILQNAYKVENINITLPSAYHKLLYQTLISNSQTNIHHFSIFELDDEKADNIDSYTYHQFINRTLEPSQSTLESLIVPNLPSDVLVSHHDHLKFPHVTHLHISLVNSKERQNLWRQLKQMFPNLIELRLNLTVDKKHVLLFKSLLTEFPLFPWIKSLVVSSFESPKDYLSQDELRNSLLQLDGLNRISAGWDMVALG